MSDYGEDARAVIDEVKDTANGIVAQDATGGATVTGPVIALTRNGSNEIAIQERTSSEYPFLVHRVAGSTYWEKVLRGGAVLNAALDANGDIPHMRPKAASANLRHSDNGIITTPATASYVFSRKYNFANGISGVIRVKFSLAPTINGQTVYGRLYKNAVAIGTEQSTADSGGVEFSEDINFGVLAPSDTIELWVKGATSNINTYNYRLYYDNAADTVQVAGVTSSY
jgi:hypothetical protein